MSLVPPYINQEWIFDLDQQLSHAGYRAVHVTTALRLVGLSWGRYRGAQARAPGSGLLSAG